MTQRQIALPASATLQQFPAVRPDESAIEVDVTDLEDDDPTAPQERPAERITERPSADDIKALCDASRSDAPWLAEPVFACDPESCRLVLAAPYKARQRDRYGNVFVIECPLGLTVEIPTSPARARALRSELVRAAMRVVTSFHVRPFSGSGEMWSPLDKGWRAAIVEAFTLGDAGALERG
jgi:hypothetical protein